ncbi:recombinase family protein [Priestia megaterium]
MAKTYGYVRVSTVHQNLDIQKEAVLNAGVSEENLFEDRVSGKNMERAGLTSLLEVVQEGDTIVVWKLDRLGRSVNDLSKMITDFRERNITVISVKDGVNTSDSTPLAKAMINLLSTFAEMERDFILERTQAGVERAKSNGTQFGRKPVNKKNYAQAVEMYMTGKYTVPEVLGKFDGLTEATFYRRLKKARDEQALQEGK